MVIVNGGLSDLTVSEMVSVHQLAPNGRSEREPWLGASSTSITSGASAIGTYPSAKHK